MKLKEKHDDFCFVNCLGLALNIILSSGKLNSDFFILKSKLKYLDQEIFPMALDNWERFLLDKGSVCSWWQGEAHVNLNLFQRIKKKQ